MDKPIKRYNGWKEIVPFVNMGGQKTIRRLHSAWGFPLHKLGKKVWVFEDEVEAWCRLFQPAGRKMP